MTDELRQTPGHLVQPGHSDRSRRSVPGPLHLIGSDQVPLRVILRRSAWDDIDALHAPAGIREDGDPATDDERRHDAVGPERGGLLVGHLQDDDLGPFLLIEGVVAASAAENSEDGFQLSRRAWDEMEADMTRRFPGQSIVGWFILRPGRGVFLTERDRAAARRFFGEPWQITYVIDPVRGRQGLFCWADGRLQALPGFWVWDDDAPAAGETPGVVAAAAGAARKPAADETETGTGRVRYSLLVAATCLLLAWLVLPLPGSLSSLKRHVQDYSRETEQLQEQLSRLQARRDALQQVLVSMDETAGTAENGRNDAHTGDAADALRPVADQDSAGGDGGSVNRDNGTAPPSDPPSAAGASAPAGPNVAGADGPGVPPLLGAGATGGIRAGDDAAGGNGGSGENSASPAPRGPASPAFPGDEAEPLEYVVRPGDTLWSISARLLGNPHEYARVASENDLTNPDLILPGWELRLPPGGDGGDDESTEQPDQGSD